MKCFELPVEGVIDYDGLLDVIHRKRAERTPSRQTNRWLRYDPPPPDTLQLLVTIASEDTVKAEQYARNTLLPKLLSRTPIALNFRNMTICTQSYMHALLYESLRVAWALKTPIYVMNAAPAVSSTLRLLESYALSA